MKTAMNSQTINLFLLRNFVLGTFVAATALAVMGCKPELTCDATHACPSINMSNFSENLGNGFSGMARIDDNNFLVVHDYKNYGSNLNRRRLGFVSVNGIGSAAQYRYQNLENVHHARQIEGWPRVKPTVSHGGVANDLESACALRGFANQFLVAESGTYNDGLQGREKIGGYIFRVTLNLNSQTYEVATNTNELPGLDPNTSPSQTTKNLHLRKKQQSLENYEGLACWQMPEGNDGKYLVLLGERGATAPEPGSGPYETFERTEGAMQWAVFDPSNDPCTWQSPINGIVAPGMHSGGDPACWRDISGLYVDADRKIWATAAYDAALDDISDPCNKSAPRNGKNRSVVYQLGAICLGPNDMVLANGECAGHASYHPARLRVFTPIRKIDGYKVEAITAPQGSSSSELTIASEDENGGSWWNKR